MLPMLQTTTCFRERLPQSQPNRLDPVTILCLLLSRFQAQAQTNWHAGKLLNILEHVSTSVLRSPRHHRLGLERFFSKIILKLNSRTFMNKLFMTFKVDRSVLEALPAELREQVERSWTHRDLRQNNRRSPSPQLSSLGSCSTSPLHPAATAPALHTLPVETLVLQISNQPDNQGIVLQLPNFSQVRMTFWFCDYKVVHKFYNTKNSSSFGALGGNAEF